jgi:hypothetical protein
VILHLPLSVMIPRKTKEDKKVALNLNIYRNLHHITNNQAKAIFADMVRAMLEYDYHWDSKSPGLMMKPPYRFTYTLFQQSGRATDVANVLAIVDKFTCDSLVDLAVLSDDNHKIIQEVVYRYGGVDKDNPRAVLEIESIGEK